MRILLYTGKGGVGKTTIAAASALKSASLGHKTLVISTDAAHSLGDSLDTELSGEAREVAHGLWAQELDIHREIDVHWGTLQKWLSAIMASRGMEKIMADEMAILPGMEEMAGLLYLLKYHDDAEYDTIVVDCAPTGETLRLLSFPEVLGWWMEHIYPLERKAAKMLRPILRTFSDVPLPGDEVFDAVGDLFGRLKRLNSILTDPEKTSVRLVLNPEKMVIKEAQRTFTYLNLYDHNVDLIVSNRVLPPEVTDPYFTAWRESQNRYDELIVESFAPLPIKRVPLMDHEVVGFEMLNKVASTLFEGEDDDPNKLFFAGKPRDIQHVGDHYTLTIMLPFVEKSDISLTQHGDELTVEVGHQRRSLILPYALVGKKAQGAKFENETLKIDFR
ncbi:MAG: ArsA family ATPase [Dehalococcoidia bacterium]|nr:ArsA family ATPase [Dehalococcoidia bacterium]